MKSERSRYLITEAHKNHVRRPYSKPSLESFGLVSEVTAGGRGSEPEVGGDNNQGIKKRDESNNP